MTRTWPHNRLSSVSLIGRVHEQRLLRRQLEHALAGHGGLVLIGGEAGIGKTTLAADLSREAEQVGALVLWGQSYDLSVTPPYGPWLEIFRRYRALESDLPAAPALLSNPEELARVGSQEALFIAVADVFSTIAACRSLVLVLDDLHWADLASLDLFRFLARELPGHRILLVATYRSDELQQHHPLYTLLPLLVREAGAERLDVRPLAEEGRRALIHSRYVLAQPEQVRLERYLADHAEGNPFYTVELLRSLEEAGVLRRHDGGWTLGDVDGLPVPPLLRQVVEGRLRHLGETTRQLLQVASVIGQEVPLRLWQQVSGADDDALATALEVGRQAHLIEEIERGSGYRFHHALLRQALYEEVVAPRRKLWHRAAAEVLSTAPSPDPDTLAYHFLQAGDDRAADWLLQAGERAQRAFAWLTAADRFEAVVGLMEAREAEAGEHGWLLLRVGWLRRMAEPRRSVDALDETLRLASMAGDRILEAYGVYSRGMFRGHSGDVRGGIGEMEDGLARIGALSPAEREHLQRRLAAWELDEPYPQGILSTYLAIAGRYTEARRLAETVVVGNPPPFRPGRIGGSGYADGFSTLMFVHAAFGEKDEARRSAERAEEIFHAIGDDFQRGLNMADELALIVLPYETERLSERRRLADLATGTLGRAGGVRSYDPLEGCLPLLVLEGHWREARQRFAEAFRDPVIYRVGITLGPLTREQGDAAGAWALVRDRLPGGPATEPGGIPFMLGLVYQRLAAALALDAGDLDAARDWLQANDRWIDWSGAVWGRAEGALAWATYYRAAGDHVRSRRHVERAFSQAAEPRQPLTLIGAYRVLGQLQTDEQQFDRAEESLMRSLELAEACAAPFERALTRYGMAELRAAQVRIEAARALLTEVRAACTEMDAERMLARVTMLEAQLSARPARRRVRYPAGLTAREVEVLRLVAQGMTDLEVADRLFIGRRTVGTHLASIYTKLQVNSRTAAALFAVEHGLA